jgi:GNAT superfamily N-acetyltransferase
MEAGYRILRVKPQILERHIPDIIAVRSSAFEPWNGPRSQAQQREEAAAWLARVSQWRSPLVLVAEWGHEPIGYLLAHEREGGDCHIRHAGVRQECQRQGIGRALLRRCEAEALAGGNRALTVTTYNRFRGMLILLLGEGFDIEGVTWVPGATGLRVLLRKDLAPSSADS